MTRSSIPSLPVFAVLVITPKPPRLLIVPSGFNCRFETLALGLAKCGVFVRFSAYARN